jgi:hypothetical protein
LKDQRRDRAGYVTGPDTLLGNPPSWRQSSSVNAGTGRWSARSVDVGQVERTLQPGDELVWQETTRDERIGLIIRPPAGKQRWIVFFMETA